MRGRTPEGHRPDAESRGSWAVRRCGLLHLPWRLLVVAAVGVWLAALAAAGPTAAAPVEPDDPAQEETQQAQEEPSPQEEATDSQAEETPSPEPEPTQEPDEAEPTDEPTQETDEVEPQEEPAPVAPAPVQTAPPAVNQELSGCGELAEEGALDEEAQDEETPVPLIEDAPAVFSQVGVEAAWEVSRGTDVVVAVVSSGVDASNPHLEGAVVPGADLMSGGDGTVDEDGQGTAVAGLIASRPVEDSGLVGVARESLIMPVRVFSGTSEAVVEEGRGPQAWRTAQGIRWAADNGAQVVVVPQALEDDAPELAEAVAYAAQEGALVVASGGQAEQGEPDSGQGGAQGSSATSTPAGTGGASPGAGDGDQDTDTTEEPRYPAAYEEALGVTALDADAAVSDAVVHGSHLDLAVPAQSVLTTFLGQGDCLVARNAPSASLATGYAAGVAALVVAAYPQEDPAEWGYRLTVTALRAIPEQASPTVGWGVIAPYAALDFVNDGTALGPDNPRGARQAATPAQAWATPPVSDPGPARRASLARRAGTAGAVVLALGLVGSRIRSGNASGSRSALGGGGGSAPRL
ncbi:peptidase S8 [Actinomyces lilanjuaniae]|uniref:Peptidase S8 n=1 Tax=Actinomyces lilanjuaniae TaxID=2321394 RepID=A0ABM6Z1D4_9ACTO|nr:S8 family serine peptidase [Actinomyces lilanjuaniae]AYD88945.1 peptidase S8 [Actinomyces lilanjuaniae]